MILTYNKHNITYGLTYFNESYVKQQVDVIYEWQYSEEKRFSEEFYTLFIDLNEDEEVIFSRFEKNTKYEINRAINKDGIAIETFNAKTDRQLFYDFYNQFAMTKEREPIDTRETDLLIDNNMFIIRAASLDNEYMVFHSYAIANRRARLMHSASLFREADDNTRRNLIGRANRLLHWEDIRYFKNLKFAIYDLGGIAMDKSNTQGQAINKFKECFGGTLVKEYKTWIPITLKGWALVCYKAIRRKL
jgi:lipid II:glycine glycyltransferase (peptidoglycan interpeptide bridge formation enzyme)